jgi:hypothetical protein
MFFQKKSKVPVAHYLPIIFAQSVYWDVRSKTELGFQDVQCGQVAAWRKKQSKNHERKFSFG